MKIVRATLDDLQSIIKIENESFNHPFKEKDLVYEISENPFATYLLAKDELNNVIGFIDFWITFDSATINQIAVALDARRQGVATKLIEESEIILKKENVEFFTLEVRKSNQKAINLYEKCGFSKITIKEKYYENGEDAIYMAKGEI